MPNYQNGKIYTIRCRSDDTLIYVGSTAQRLSQRLATHRSSCKEGHGCSLYDYIVNDNWDDWYIELFEVYPCNSKEELLKKEGDIIRQIGTINKRIAGRTRREHYEENMDKKKEYDKEYYKINAEKKKEDNKKYREENANKINEYQKEYRGENANKIKEYKKEYSKNNEDKIKQYQKQYRMKNKNTHMSKIQNNTDIPSDNHN